MLKCHIKKIATPASWVEHENVAELFKKSPYLLPRFRELVPFGERYRGGFNRFPLAAEGLDDGRENEPLDVGTRGVMSPKFVPVDGVKGSLEERSKNRRFHGPPIGFGCVDDKL